METPPRQIVGNVKVLLAGRSAKAISRHFTKSYLAKSCKDAWMYADHFVPQLKHCWLRNVNKHTLKAGPGAPGMDAGYTLSQLLHSPKWRMGHSSGVCNTDLAWLHPEAGCLRGKQLPGAKQPCKAPLEHIGRRAAWCARRARNSTQPAQRLPG